MSRSLVRSRRRGASRVAIAAIAAVGLIVSLPAAASAAAPTSAQPPTAGDGGTSTGSHFAPGRYIVTLSKPALSSYSGGVHGYAATKAAAGRKVQLQTTAARRYQAVLSHDQNSLAASVGARPTSHYSVTLNGFSATLTSRQAQQLAGNPAVLAVTKDKLQTIQDDKVDYDFLRLAGTGGVWNRLGGTRLAGKGIVIGVIDTGIWPEAHSFAGHRLGTQPSATNPFQAYRVGAQIAQRKANGDTFTGACEVGERFTAANCNTKLISARYFGESFLASTPANQLSPDESISPRDGEGHGTHTASTAGGNYAVAASVDGRSYGKISGVAPAASIAAYKALWECVAPCVSGGFNSDIIAAIDQAVADGVDVINYSVGSTTESSAVDPVQLAFLSAASAGVFVSASAGNGGPGASTLDNTSPWVTTVAASTMQPYESTVVLGNGKKYVGASITVQSTVGPAALVAGGASAASGQSPVAAALCGPGSLDPAKVTGKIVECDRGVYDRVAKSAEVKRAGGIGTVLVNLTPKDTDSDSHTLPTIHLDAPGGLEVRAYALTAGATASLVPGNTTGIATPYPQVAGFSSRGPSLASDGSLLKPDIAAPGVGVLAAVAPIAANNGRNFDFLSGTSMAAPHIAGLAALYKGRHPSWGPMAIKSAIMTTAHNTVNADGTPNTDPFAQGAGQVTPSRMFTPGLVYNSGDDDWLRYLEGLGYDTGTGAGAVDPSDYNTPSIAVGSLVGSRTVTRTVTAITPGLYRATASVPGFSVRVTPSILHFNAPGDTARFRVVLTRTNAPLGEFATGFLTWTGSHISVRSPIAVKPLAVRNTAPQVSLSGASGSTTWNVQSGISGPFPIRAYGLAAAKVTPGSVTAGQSATYPVLVPAGTKAVRFSAFGPPDSSGADIDLSLYQVIDGSPVLIAQSASASAREAITLIDPEAAQYVAKVDGFANATGTSTTPYSFRSYVVGSTGGVGSFTATPANSTTTSGQTVAVTASYSGVSATTPYLGVVQFVDGSTTLVKVNGE